MWRQDEKGNALSGARNAKRTLPNARRDIHRTKNSRRAGAMPTGKLEARPVLGDGDRPGPEGSRDATSNANRSSSTLGRNERWPKQLGLRSPLCMGSIRFLQKIPLPPSGTSVSPRADSGDGGIRLLMAAVELGEPRKRIVWMLQAMKKMNPPPGTVLQLAGDADDSVRRAAAQVRFPVEFLGHLKREKLQQVMRQAHIFCLGSLLDDWGYLLVEAMANGLTPVAPAVSPFNEILDGVGLCYSPHSQSDFIRALR